MGDTGTIMQFNPNPKVRLVIYIIVVMLTALIVPLHAAGVVNDTILAVWTSIAGAASLLAGINVSSK